MSITDYGKVYLVGAGPGNPNLLTKKAQRIIQQADVILYDRLVNPLIIQYASPNIEIIDVGKRPYNKHIQQCEINERIIECARHHQCVVRLKGGDPAIFGRVQEEIDTLRQHHIDFEVIPGVTSASVAVASMDIGLTMRTLAKSVTFSTGHFKDSENNDVNINSLLNGGTLAVYMGIKRLTRIIMQIQQYSDYDYPIAAVFNASCFNEIVITGHLSDIVARISEHDLVGIPGVCIIGDVVEKVKMENHLYKSSTPFYIVEGEQQQALTICEELYDKGYGCLLNITSKETYYHPSQYSYYQSFIAQQPHTEIYIENN